MITCLEIKERAIGNSLFEYATLFAVAKRLNLIPKIPKGQEYINHTGHKIQMIHDGFELSIDFLSDNDKIEHLFKERYDNYYEEDVFKINDNTNIRGYFQDIRYFENHITELQHELSFNKDVLEQSKEMFSSLNVNPMDYISMHVRRKDFVTDPNCVFLPSSYYFNAFKQFPTQNVIIFSDESEWVRKNYPQYITVPTNSDAFIDLCMMSLCRDNILSNSTFGWWGAFLNKNSGKKVVYPLQWFRYRAAPNLFFKDWIGL